MTMNLRDATVSTEPGNIFLQGGKVDLKFKAVTTRPQKCKTVFARIAVAEPYRVVNPDGKLVSFRDTRFKKASDNQYSKTLEIVRKRDYDGNNKERVLALTVAVWEPNNKDEKDKGFETAGGCDIDIVADFAERRKAAGFVTKAALERAVSVGTAAVANFEAGSNVRLDTLRAILAKVRPS